MHLHRIPHAEDGQREIRRREAFEGAEVARAFRDGASEAVDRPFAPSTGPLSPEVPPLTHELFGSWHLQRVANPRPVNEPSGVFTKATPHIRNRDVDRVVGDVRAVPGLGQQCVVVHELSDVLQQHPQRVERAPSQPHLHSIPRQLRRSGVQPEGPEREFRHLGVDSSLLPAKRSNGGASSNAPTGLCVRRVAIIAGARASRGDRVKPGPDTAQNENFTPSCSSRIGVRVVLMVP
jgi:hypothetical protein